MDSFGNLFVAEENNHLIRKLTLNCVYSTYNNQTCFSSGFLGSTRTVLIGYPAQCTALTSQTTTACCFITSQWSAFSTCSTQGTFTRTRTGTSACTTELSETVVCCYTSAWSNATCNTSTGLMNQVCSGKIQEVLASSYFY